MTLPDLIDLEAQLARDRDAAPAAVAARDRALLRDGAAGDALRGGRKGDGPGALFAAWLEALREHEPGRLHPGATVAAALRGVRSALVVGGLALGWGAAAAVLRYTGRDPVNVWDFLLAFVLLQVLLFALLLGSFVLPLAAVGRPLLGVVRGVVAAVYPRLAGRALQAGGARAEEWRALWHRLRSRRSLYHHVEPWLLLGMTQAFGVAFNVGALLGCLRLVVFSDVAFSWSTTLVELDAARFHAIVHALSAPFAWALPQASPTRELVEATRYSRLEGAYVLSGARRALRPDLVGGWWPFLLASLACYGFLPRAATLLAATLRTRRLLARLPLDDAELARLARRLAEPDVATGALDPDVAGPARSAAPRPAAANGAAPAARCAVVLWRDVPAVPDLDALVARKARCAVARVQAAGGRDYEEGGVEWARVVDGAERVVVVAEAFEAPDRATLRLLREVRAAAGARRHVLVLLVGASPGGLAAPAAEDVRLWQEGLAPLADPYLEVEPAAGAGALP
jgi:uncharacterized protein DUF2868